MELHGVPPCSHHSRLGEEKHQMLDLNHRLETYLDRVKLLEEENLLLHREIHALKCSHQGAATHRKGLKDELHKVRLDVEEAWAERDRADLEVSCLAEEIQSLELRRKRVAEAQLEAKEKLLESRRVMEEEQRAQVWLREKVHQLEQEIHLLIQSHQEDVVHLETTLTHSRPALMPRPPTTYNHNPGLLQLAQEYSQQVTRAWTEAAEVYQGQVARLEESLKQSASHLAHTSQEKNESLWKLQVLEKELASAQDIRHYLENNMDQQRDRNNQELHNLHEQAMGLEVQKEELRHQIESLMAESRTLLELQLSLGLEVTTYRSFLENESLQGVGSSVYHPRNSYTADAVASLHGIKQSYRSKRSTSQIATPISSIRGIKSGSKPARTTTKSIYIWKPRPLSQSFEISQYNAEAVETTKSDTWAVSYPKVQQGDTVEHFRPQQVHEKIIYAEPLMSLNEREAVCELKYGSSQKETLKGEQKVQEDWLTAADEHAEEDCVMDSAITSKIILNTEASRDHFNTGTLEPHSITEKSSDFIDVCDKYVPVELPAPTEAWMEVQVKEKTCDPETEATLVPTIDLVREETSDSETAAVFEPTFDQVNEETSDSETEAVLERILVKSSTSNPVSECEPEEIVFDQMVGFNHEETSSTTEASSTSQPPESFQVGTNIKKIEDHLYPDGEEMDTWDSVIERKADLKTDDPMKCDINVTQHAEPEDDISTRDLDHKQKKTIGEASTFEQHINTDLPSSVIDLELNIVQQEKVLLDQQCDIQNNEKDNDEEDDSQNVSVSWRMELESDSYAQENTLADTRPLIRYKSDETDANTQASHMDESESSEGEGERRVDESEIASKSKRFGTMEDLCEEALGGGLDEGYDLGYTSTENRDVGKQATLESGEKNTHADIDIAEDNSDEDTEEVSKQVVQQKSSDVYYNEELEMVDRLVEQELESLSTATYSAQFAQHNKAEEKVEQEFKEISREDFFYSTNPEVTVHNNEKPTSLENAHKDILAQLEVQHENLETRKASEKGHENNELNVSMLTHVDPTEDLNNWPGHTGMNNADFEELHSSDDESLIASQCSQPISTANVKADQETLAIPDKLQNAELVEMSSASSKHSGKEAADGQPKKSELLQTMEWEVLGSQNKDLETNFQLEYRSDTTKSYCHTEDIPYQGAMKKNEESPDVSPESIPAESLKDNGKYKGIHDLFKSGISDDFWGSNLETGATYQPEDFERTDEHTNQNLGNEGNIVWGNFENAHAANGKHIGTDPSNVLAAKEDVKMQPLCGEVVDGDLIHSDDSQDEGRSWSSGE